jgi:hypothetical protein
MRRMMLCLGVLVALVAPARAGGGLQIHWYTIDGGGEVFSIGGAFELSGTIGQPDASRAGVLRGGPYHLTGGFWGAGVIGVDDLIFRDGFE